MAIAALATTPDQLAFSYRLRAEEYAKAKEYAKAHTCFERLIRLGWKVEESRMQLALTLDAEGKTERARAIMEPFAPLEGSGKPMAQLWMAKWLLTQPGLDARRLHDAEAQLLHVLQSDPKSMDAHAMLAQLYATAGRPKDARPHLEIVVKEHPELLLHLAAILVQEGNNTAARGRAEMAQNASWKQTQSHPDDHEARLRWAAATLFLEDYTGAERILREGLERGEVPAFHKALAGIYLAWADALAKDPHSDAGAWLTLLEQGLRHDPANTNLLGRLGSVMNHASEDEAARARSALQSLLTEGRATAIVHYLLGLDAWQHDQPDAARLHWETAHRMGPELDVVTNNLAWALSGDPAPDLPRALDLINQALTHSPGQSSLLGTRGHIFLRMKLWKEALVDLEAALSGEWENPDLHRDLASTYAALGMPELASEHKRLAEQRPTQSKN